MNHPITQRLKPLLDTVPPGFVVDTPWLTARGIDAKSIHDYVARGWLERLVRGVYRRPVPQGTPDAGGDFWAILLLSLQRLMNYPVHLGGETALDLAGHAHYLNLGGPPRVRFYGDVPSWLRRLPTGTEIVVRRRALFGDDSVGIEEFDTGAGAMVDVWRWPVWASSPERAILEALDELPRHASFDNLDKVFEGLVALRPSQLTTLLGACRSVKVRRLFFVFADRHGHGWRNHLDTSTIDFGSGPRALFDGGRFHPDYRISVPETLLPAQARPADGDA
ncbi:MAG: type IV toxin-antitoxin system AbiEi family antitoxin domain-containing protein [Gammaproteobacteria bacterium]|nr:type IV toxin-antitoxin system AbiEi family antitoxin domain-containing protein [Gammaproteobacteria bacterium]